MSNLSETELLRTDKSLFERKLIDLINSRGVGAVSDTKDELLA
jgi:hypothetical protein